MEVTTDANGFNSAVMITALAQTLKLNLNESPFYADWGIPAHQSVMTRVFPDYYVKLTQQRYSTQFASLNVVSVPDPPNPHYLFNLITQQGAMVSGTIPQ